MRRSINRSAKTGRFVRAGVVRRSRSTTTTERVGAGTGNRRAVFRSASTGRFVTSATAARRPTKTIRQFV